MYTLSEVRKVQMRLLEMAVAVRDILESYEIPYFITYGTLLGAVRHHGFIPWDDDFDIYLFDECYEMAMDVLLKHLPSGMFLENKKTEPNYFHGWAHVKDMNSLAECGQYPQDSSYTHKGISLDLYKTKKICEKEEKYYRLSEEKSYLIRRKEVGQIGENQFELRMALIEKDLDREVRMLRNIEDKGKEIYAFSIFYDDRLYLNELFPLTRYSFENTEFYGPANAAALLSRCYGDYMKLPPVEKRIPHYTSVYFMNNNL